jgi:hypothetical protein
MTRLAGLTQDGRAGLEVCGARMVPHATKVPAPRTTGFLISHWASSFHAEHVEHVLPTHHNYFLNPTGGSTHFYVEIISRTAPPTPMLQMAYGQPLTTYEYQTVHFLHALLSRIKQ